MSHFPNPFDFVPFAAAPPELKLPREWLKTGALKTGYLEVQIKALTPLHSVGNQDAVATEPASFKERKDGKKNFKIKYSHFTRRHGQALIHSSSIRGLLRSFVEAACNGWASQITPFYVSESGKRKIGFRVVDDPDELKKEKAEHGVDITIPPSLEKYFVVPKKAEKGIDLASFLFGYIPAEGEGWHGRIKIEDAHIAAGNLSDENKTYRMPDVEDSAFMGGPNPSASSWWYQYPHHIRLRHTQKFDVCDFVGSGYRGRKFYYHQNPAACVNWYLNKNNWEPRKGHPIYYFPVECLVAGRTSEVFRIDFEEIPEETLKLLLLILSPGNRLRHKLGYGKAYGFGSIEFIITGGTLHGKGFEPSTRLNVAELQKELQDAFWDQKKLDAIGVGKFLNRESLEKLARILWYEEPLSQLFHYPPFGLGGFQPIVRSSDLWTVLKSPQADQLRRTKLLKVDAVDAQNIASKLAEKGRRPALHFEAYQSAAQGYDAIQKRNLAVAETA